MKHNMIKVIRRSKIEKVLEELAKDRSSLQLWQNKDDESRKTNTVHTLRFDKNKKEVVFTSKEKKFDFDYEKVLYCFWEGSSMIFKTRISFMSEFKLAVSLPDYLMTKEKRRDPRTDFSRNEQSIHYHLGVSTDTTHEVFPFSSKILDFSEGGVGLLVNLANISKFHIGDNLTLKIPINDNQIVEGRVTHITKPVPSISATDYNVGISFV
jgi:hypothetical protein